eukprot:COSAG06_NODE_250_length_19080_cov_6.483029_14_plen_94_part_00
MARTIYCIHCTIIAGAICRPPGNNRKGVEFGRLLCESQYVAETIGYHDEDCTCLNETSARLFHFYLLSFFPPSLALFPFSVFKARVMRGNAFG